MSTEESIIILHDVISNSITHHPRIRRAPLFKEELIFELLKIRNLSGIVYVQRNVPDIYQYLATKSGFHVFHLSRDLLSKRKQRDTTIAPRLQVLHICPSLELKFLVLVKRVKDDLLGFKRKTNGRPQPSEDA